MPSIRQVVGDIRSMNKLYSQDQSITDRAISRELRTTASLLIKRETDRRKLFNTQTIFTKISCISMCEVPLSSCCDYKSDCTIRKSQCKIKGIADLGTFGMAIQGVFNIEGSKKYSEVSPTRYTNLLKLNTPGKENYFWVDGDGYIFVTDPNVEAINLIAYFADDLKLEGENCQCSDVQSDDCVNPLDQEFKCPDYLIENVKTIVNQKLAEIYKRSIPDNSSNELDESR